jgi:asparagine synthase (glutamine-hydrolysing)
MTLAGSDPGTVRRALEAGNALSGADGFAGELDGTLVRDVLGREPLFFDGDEWSQDPTDLSNPRPLPPGHVRDGTTATEGLSLPDPAPVSLEAGVERVRTATTGAIDAVDTDGLAVAFSGGLDSAFVAARLDAPVYTVGLPDSHDIAAARSGATLMGRDLTVHTITPEDIEAAIPEVVTATGRTNAMDVQIALPLYLLARRLREDGYQRVALGQGADELFGGYAKVARAPEDPRVEAETVRGARREMVETLPAQLERDVLTLRAAGVEPVVPLLTDRVVNAALELPGEALVTDRGERKWALRLAARPDVPDRVVFREKKAVQYGSLVARELDRLARTAGFKRRQDDHVTGFIDSVTGDVPGVPRS